MLVYRPIGTPEPFTAARACLDSNVWPDSPPTNHVAGCLTADRLARDRKPSPTGQTARKSNIFDLHGRRFRLGLPWLGSAPRAGLCGPFATSRGCRWPWVRCLWTPHRRQNILEISAATSTMAPSLVRTNPCSCACFARRWLPTAGGDVAWVVGLEWALVHRRGSGRSRGRGRSKMQRVVSLSSRA